MKTPRALLLLGLLTLAACGNTSTPTPTPPTQPPITAPKALRSYGLYDLSISGASSGTPVGSVSRTDVPNVNEVRGLEFSPVSFGTYTDEAARVRYLRATFRVTNNTAQSLAAPTFVPVDTDGTDATTGTTPFKQVEYFDGSDASERTSELQLDTARRLNSATGVSEVDPDATPLLRGLDTRGLVVTPTDGTTITRVFPEGWQGKALAAGGSQLVTFATRIPMAADTKHDPFRFKLVFAVTDQPAALPNDQTAPTIKLSVTPSRLTAVSEATFQADAQDDQGVRDVVFYDGDTLLGTDSTAPYEWKKAYNQADNGEHTIRAVATDTSGNKAESRAQLTISISQPQPADATLGADLVRSNRGEAVSGSAVSLYRSGERGAALASSYTDAQGHVEFARLPAGTYDLVFSHAGSAGSEVLGVTLRPGTVQRLKVAQYDAQNPTAEKTVPRLALLTPTGLNADGEATGWQPLTPGMVMNSKLALRAYTTADNASPLQLKYLMFSLVSFDAAGQMSEMRNALSSMDAGHVTPGEGNQDSGLVMLDAAGLSGDLYVQVSSLDFNNNRSAYLVPVRLETGVAPGSVSAPTGVSAVAYTNSERINYIYSVPSSGTQSVAPDSNSWVSVSWDMPASTDGIGFRVLRATDPQGPYSEVAFAGAVQCKVATKRCTVSDNTATLQVGQDYYYRVKAVGQGEAISDIPSRPNTQILPPFAPQLLSPGSEQTDVDLTPVYTFRTGAFAGGATGLRFDLRLSDSFTSVGNTDAPPLRLIAQNGSYHVTGADADTRDYGKWVSYDPTSDVLKVPHDLVRLRSGLSAQPLQANRRYSWMLHRAYAYRLLDPMQPESASNPVVAYSVYSDPDTTKIVPGGVTQSASAINHFITRP